MSSETRKDAGRAHIGTSDHPPMYATPYAGEPSEPASGHKPQPTPGDQPDMPTDPRPKPARDAKGRWAKGNRTALVHGLRATTDDTNELPAEFARLKEDVDRFTSGCVSDEGGDITAIPTRRLAQLEYRARLHRRILQIDAALELHGITDRRGKLRAGWLSQLNGLITTASNIDRLLTLDRIERDITTVTAAEYANNKEDK